MSSFPLFYFCFPSLFVFFFFFFNDTATTEIYTLSLHDALPISSPGSRARWSGDPQARAAVAIGGGACPRGGRADRGSGIADRDQQHRVTRGRGPRRPAPPGHGPAPGARAAGAGRGADARRIPGRADARRRARGGP